MKIYQQDNSTPVILCLDVSHLILFCNEKYKIAKCVFTKFTHLTKLYKLNTTSGYNPMNKNHSSFPFGTLDA